VKSKTDTKDSAVLARYDALLKPFALQPSPPEVRRLRALLARLESIEIDRHPQLKKDRVLLESIPAVGAKTATKLLSVLRAHHFRNALQAAAYLGLIPVEHQSDSSIYKRPQLAKNGNRRIRAPL